MFELLDERTVSDTALSKTRIRLLLTAAISVGQSLEPDRIAQATLWLAADALRLPVSLIALYVDQRCLILASQGISESSLNTFKIATVDTTDTIVQQIMVENKSLIIDDVTELETDPVVSLFGQENAGSLICHPLKAPEGAKGVMIIGGEQNRIFDVDDIETISEIAKQFNVSLHNAWLHTQSQIQLRELKSVTDTAYAVVSSLDSKQILNRILEDVLTGINAETATLLLLDQYRKELRCEAAAGTWSDGLKGLRIQFGEGAAGWVAENNQSLRITETEAKANPSSISYGNESLNIHSILCVPLRARGQLIGIIEARNKKQGQFSKKDQRLLEALATFAALAIENAQFYEEANLQIQQATLYAHDLSATYKREREQREALDQLRFSFLNSVGHELKTPLTVMMQGLETLKHPQHGNLSPSQIETIEMIENQSNYLGKLITNVMTFTTFTAKQGKMKCVSTDFETVLDEVVTLSQFKARPKNITFDELRDTPLPPVTIDTEQVTEAILYIIDNALKFSPEHGTVTLKIQADANDVILDIIDQGPGIPADQIEKIWDSFTQMNTSMARGLEGLGLGLAMARYIVEAHKGRLAVTSEFGEGSIFTIRLPHNAR